ncbi:hypothetical protein BDZ89DRAFT_432314 [Hymenopellis radicata]|nr:hypothetical protein BDZ89DRAFT_432314 [Hymenopellis radicata]
MWSPCSGCSCANHHVPLASDFKPGSKRDMTCELSEDSMTRLLRSNDCPLFVESKAIRGVISDAQQNLDQIQSRIDRLNDVFVDTVTRIARMNALVAELQTQQRRIQEFLKERQNLLSPVRRLPTEVLQEIFIDTVEYLSYEWEVNDAGVNICNITRPKSSLWNILRVSRLWRSALLSCSQAWSYITILDADQFNARDYNDSRRIARHLEYSRQYPLSVVIFYDPQGATPHDFPEKLLSSLLHYSNRIRHLHLCIPAAAFPQLHPLNFSWNSLRDLSIMPTSFSSLEDVPHENLPVVDAFANAPNLCDVRLMQVLSESQFELPWRQIKHYRNTTWVIPRVEDILRIFKVAVSLETFNFDSDIEPPLEKLVLVTPPVLHTLVYVLDMSYCYLPSLLDNLSIPTLRHLALSTSHDQPDPDHLVMPSIIRLMERSRCSLRVLALSKVPTSSKELEQLMLLIPLLEELWLTNIGSEALSDSIIVKMTVTEGKDDADLLLPRLREMDLEGDWELTPEVFARMIESRWRRPPPYRLWSLGIDLANPGCLMELLATCKNEGMSVTVETSIRARDSNEEESNP